MGEYRATLLAALTNPSYIDDSPDEVEPVENRRQGLYVPCSLRQDGDFKSYKDQESVRHYLSEQPTLGELGSPAAAIDTKSVEFVALNSKTNPDKAGLAVSGQKEGSELLQKPLKKTTDDPMLCGQFADEEGNNLYQKSMKAVHGISNVANTKEDRGKTFKLLTNHFEPFETEDHLAPAVEHFQRKSSTSLAYRFDNKSKGASTSSATLADPMAEFVVAHTQ